MNLGVIMDPIGTIDIKKDSTFEMLLQAQKLGWSLSYFEQNDLSILDGKACGRARALTVAKDNDHWFDLGQDEHIELAALDVLLMRKDPPFDMEYVYSTYILELAEQAGVTVVNAPQALRDCNEKAYCAWFPELCPSTLISREDQQIRDFLARHKDIILKPLDGMGGASIFRMNETSKNIGVIIETLTEHGQRYAMAQAFVPAIVDGDKRILMVNGEAVPYALARIPAEGETRGNLAVGATGRAQTLSDSDWAITKQVGPKLLEKNILFAGLDVIGDKLTEINITSPTCIVEINNAYGTNIARDLLQAIEHMRNQQ